VWSNISTLMGDMQKHIEAFQNTSRMEQAICDNIFNEQIIQATLSNYTILITACHFLFAHLSLFVRHLPLSVWLMKSRPIDCGIR
jgi:hypothetical protein